MACRPGGVPNPTTRAIPAVLLTMVRPLAPWSRRATSRQWGIPPGPAKPSMNTVAPLGRSRIASRAVGKTLLGCSNRGVSKVISRKSGDTVKGPPVIEVTSSDDQPGATSSSVKPSWPNRITATSVTIKLTQPRPSNGIVLCETMVGLPLWSVWGIMAMTRTGPLAYSEAHDAADSPGVAVVVQWVKSPCAVTWPGCRTTAST